MSTIVDDGDAGYAENAGGGWYALGNGYQGDARYNLYATNYAEWTFTGLTAGNSYKVGVTWPEQFNLATDASYEVYDSDGTTVLATATFNQVHDPSTNAGSFTDTGQPWAQVGTVTPSGTSLKVRVTVGNSYTVADAAIVVDQGGSAALGDDGLTHVCVARW